MLRRLSALFGAIALLCLPSVMHGQYVSVSSSNLVDSTGTPVSSATVCAQPVDTMGRPASVLVNGSGVAITSPVCTQATAGTWTLKLPDTSHTQPGNACFNITATDNVSGNSLIGPGYSCVQPTTGGSPNAWCNGVSCNFDNLPPMSKPVTSTVYVGQAGATGSSGQTGANGTPGCIIGTSGCTLFDPATVVQSLNAQTYPGRFAGIGELLDVGNAPILTVGASGSWDAGSIRDPSNAWVSHGKLWLLYTGAQNNLAPYNRVSLGLASTTDLTGKTGWTKVANVLGPTGSGQWNSGAIFSPWVYYDSVTDITTVYFSATVAASQWYSGPSVLGIAQVAAGADYTVPGNWIMQSSPALTAGQTWEEAQGLYAPSVVRIGNTYAMYYSSSASGTDFYVGLATATNPAGPFTKLPNNSAWLPASKNFIANTNPVFGDGYSEEPSCAVLDNGGVQCFTDDPLGVITPVGFKSFSTSDSAGITGWSQGGTVVVNNPLSFYSGHLGAMGQMKLSSGRWLLISNGSSDPSSQAVRSINAFTYTLAPPRVTSNVSKIGGCPGGGWGSSFTVLGCNGADSSLAVGYDSSHSFQFYYDQASKMGRINSNSYSKRIGLEGTEVQFGDGSGIGGFLGVGDDPVVVAGSSGSGGGSGSSGTGLTGAALYEQVEASRVAARLQLKSNVGMWRDSSEVGFTNYLNQDGYDGYRLFLGNALIGNVGKDLNVDCGFSYSATQANPPQPGSQGCRSWYGIAVGPPPAMPWQANTDYNERAVVTYNGSTYMSTSVFNSGTTFNAAQWHLVSTKMTGTESGTVFASQVLRHISISPAAVAANSCSDTVATGIVGLLGADTVSAVRPPSALGNVAVTLYTNGTDGQVVLHACNPSAAAVTPPAGVYTAVFYSAR